MKHFLALLLACLMALSLAACGPQATQENTNDQTANPESVAPALTSSGSSPIYTETDITPEAVTQHNADITGLQLRADGSLELSMEYVEDDVMVSQLWNSLDGGETWTQVELPEGWSDGRSVYSLFRDETGGFYGVFSVYDGETDQFDQTIYSQPSGESLKQIPLEESYIFSDQRLGEHALLCQDYEESTGSNTLVALDLQTGEPLWTYSLADTPHFAVFHGQVYVTDQQSTYVILDPETGEVIGDFSDNSVAVSNFYALCYADEETYFFTDMHGNLCRGVWGAEPYEILLEAENYQYSFDFNRFNHFLMTDDLTLYLVAEGKETRLFRYTYSSEAAEKSGTFTVWSLRESDTIRKAFLAFQQAHPELTLDYEVAYTALDEATGESSLPEGKTLNDVLTTLNADLLAGEGPDVLLLDGLDYTAYVEQGALANLTDLYEDTQFVGSTVSALLDGEQCYVIPARFTVPILTSYFGPLPTTLAELTNRILAGGVPYYSDGDIDAQKWEQVDEKYKRRPYLTLESSIYFYQDLLNTSAAAIVNQDGLDAEQLATFLQTFQSVGSYLEWFQFGSIDNGISLGGDESFGYGNLNVWLESFAYSDFESTALLNLNAVEQLAANLHYEAREGNPAPEASFTIAPFPGLTEGAYNPKLLLGVNAASDQQELAKEFVSTVLSMDVQKCTYGDGLPITQEAMDGQIDYFTPYMEEYGWDITQLTDFFDTLTTPVTLDQETADLLYDAAEAYCLGNCTLEEAVAKVEDTLGRKLAEQ